MLGSTRLARKRSPSAEVGRKLSPRKVSSVEEGQKPEWGTNPSSLLKGKNMIVSLQKVRQDRWAQGFNGLSAGLTWGRCGLEHHQE